MTGAGTQRRLAAILAADIVGFSRLMGADEEGTLARLKSLRANTIDPAIEAHHGRIFKTTGDGVLVEFPSAVDAVRCAARVQVAMASQDEAGESAPRLVLRIGINLGDVIVEGDDIFGDGVNIAARLEGICAPGSIAISASTHEQVRGKIEHELVDCGLHEVKNIARPVHVFGVNLNAHGIAKTGAARPPARKPRRWPMWLAGSAAISLVAIAIAIAQFPELGAKARRWVAGPEGSSHEPGSRAAIAVLPFANLSGEASRDYFSDGLSEDIINALARFPELSVISLNAVQAYKGRQVNPGEISRELGVRYVVLGSVRQSDGKLRVAVELSDAQKGTQLWSERYEGAGNEVFAIQDRIVRDLTGSLAVKVRTLEQQRTTAIPTESLEAYDLVLRARALVNSNDREANRQARELLGQATKLSPDLAEAYVVLAEAEYLRSALGWRENPAEGFRRSEELAQHALSLDTPGSNARAHAILGRINAAFGRYDQALTEADKAIELNGSDAVAYALRAEVLLWLGKIEESIAAGETARRFDPRIGSDAGVMLAMAYYVAGRYAESVAAASSFIGRFPENIYLRATRAAALAQEGKVDDARLDVEKVKSRNPFFQVEQYGTRFVSAEHRKLIQEGLRKAGF